MSNLPRMDVLFGSFVGAMVTVFMLIVNGLVSAESLLAPVTIIAMFLVFYVVKDDKMKIVLQGVVGAVITVIFALYSYYADGVAIDQTVVMTALTTIFTSVATLVFPAVQPESRTQLTVR